MNGGFGAAFPGLIVLGGGPGVGSLLRCVPLQQGQRCCEQQEPQAVLRDGPDGLASFLTVKLSPW